MTMTPGPGCRYLRGRVVPVITPRQRDVLDFIVGFIAEHAYPPTNREIARGLGFSSSRTAARHLLALQERGFVSVRQGVARGIRVLGDADGTHPGPAGTCLPKRPSPACP